MTRRETVEFEFVESVPEPPEEGIVYISTRFATAIHKCCCGCGTEIVTPLSPAGWTLIFNGETISLYPSIGSWALPCRSHYWIRGNQVIWARRFSDREIAAARRGDQEAYESLYGDRAGEFPNLADKTAPRDKTRSGWLTRIRKWLSL